MNEEVKATYKEEEYTRGGTAYMAYYQSMEEVFDFSIMDGFVDLGCNNGKLIEAIHARHPHIDVAGYDYFEWSKQYANPAISDKIIITDLSKPYPFKKKYSFVNCSEVGEHIPRDAEDIFIDNIVKASSDVILLTWSNEFDTEGQHLNPRPKSYIIERLKVRGYSYWEDISKQFSSVLANKLEGIGYNWWGDNMMVFKKDKFAHIDSSYFIQGISTDNSSHAINFKYRGLAKKPLQVYFNELTDFIHTRVGDKKGASILRVGDGDYYFLRQLPIGSANPGKRALTTSYDTIDTNLYRNLLWQNDIISISLERHDRRNWAKFVVIEFIEKVFSRLILKRPLRRSSNTRRRYIIDKLLTPITLFGIIPTLIAYIFSLRRQGVYFKKARTIITNNSLPLEVVYALISTKWIFRNFKNEIGIIAGENKINIIRELMTHKEYRDYIGVENFAQFIALPEKGAANNVLELSEKIGKEIKDSKVKIFLVGAGSAKLALIPLLRHYSNAVFIDVGGGIDAIAGILCQDRPYFAEWVNYRLENYDYSNVDFMDQGNPAWNKPEYTTVKL